MKTVKLSDHLEWVEARKAKLAAAGLMPSDEELRNKVLNRTEAKRDLLRRVEARAKAAGLPLIKSYY